MNPGKTENSSDVDKNPVEAPRTSEDDKKQEENEGQISEKIELPGSDNMS